MNDLVLAGYLIADVRLENDLLYRKHMDYTTVVSVKVDKKSWMPNLFLSSGYVNLSTHHNSGESWENSSLYAGKVQLRR